MPLISVESTTIQLRVNLSATATELKATPFFPLILLQMMVEADPHLHRCNRCSRRLFFIIKVPQIAHGIHHVHFQFGLE